MSAWMRSTIPGRCTFTTTSSPSRVVARCTCPIEADAKGTASNRANSSSTGAPSSVSMTSSTVSARSGRTSSRQPCMPSTKTGGKSPGVDATIWPSLV